MKLHSTTLHGITLHYITLHYITLHCITVHYSTLQYITLHFITLHCIALHHITFHYISLHCIALHCIALHIALHYIAVLHTTLPYTTLNCMALHCTTCTHRYIDTYIHMHAQRVSSACHSSTTQSHGSISNAPRALNLKGFLRYVDTLPPTSRVQPPEWLAQVMKLTGKQWRFCEGTTFGT